VFLFSPCLDWNLFEGVGVIWFILFLFFFPVQMTKGKVVIESLQACNSLKLKGKKELANHPINKIGNSMS
jgi:hypothetical protein